VNKSSLSSQAVPIRRHAFFHVQDSGPTIGLYVTKAGKDHDYWDHDTRWLRQYACTRNDLGNEVEMNAHDWLTAHGTQRLLRTDESMPHHDAPP
jgi:hypothetical protein